MDHLAQDAAELRDGGGWVSRWPAAQLGRDQRRGRAQPVILPEGPPVQVPHGQPERLMCRRSSLRRGYRGAIDVARADRRRRGPAAAYRSPTWRRWESNWRSSSLRSDRRRRGRCQWPPLARHRRRRERGGVSAAINSFALRPRERSGWLKYLSPYYYYAVSRALFTHRVSGSAVWRRHGRLAILVWLGTVALERRDLRG